MNRTELVKHMQAKIARGQAIIGGGAGTGLSAKCAEAAGLDFIVIYNSGRYRMAGRSSMAGLMPYGDANAIVIEMASEVLPVVKKIPVLAGVCGTDPYRNMGQFLKQVKELGFTGVQNYPTVCLYEGMIRANLEETGLGFDREVEMIAKAHELGLFTACYVANADEAEAMAAARADLIVPHMGLTTAGLIGAKTSLSLQDCKKQIATLIKAAKAVNPDVLIVAHGGPISGPDEAAEILRDVPGVHGFLGASSMERLPTEVAMVSHMTKYTNIKINQSRS